MCACMWTCVSACSYMYMQGPEAESSSVILPLYWLILREGLSVKPTGNDESLEPAFFRDPHPPEAGITDDCHSHPACKWVLGTQTMAMQQMLSHWAIDQVPSFLFTKLYVIYQVSNPAWAVLGCRKQSTKRKKAKVDGCKLQPGWSFVRVWGLVSVRQSWILCSLKSTRPTGTQMRTSLPPFALQSWDEPGQSRIDPRPWGKQLRKPAGVRVLPREQD